MIKDLFCKKLLEIYNVKSTEQIMDKEAIAMLPFSIFKDDGWDLTFLDMDWFKSLYPKDYDYKEYFLEIFNRSNDKNRLNRIIVLYSLYDEKYWENINLLRNKLEL